jgi:hypothetical protein
MKTIYLKVLVFMIAVLNIILFGQEKYLNHSVQLNDTGSEKVKLVIRSAPDFTFEFSTFYDYGVYELSGNYNGDFNPEQFVKGENFGVRHGIGAILTGKIPLHHRGNLRANISLSYNVFSSKYNKSLSAATEYDYMKYSVVSGIFGIENNFTPNFKFKTYAGLGLIASVIYGEGRITYEGTTNNLSIIPAFRLGLCVNSGLEYMVTNKLGINCGIRFTHANLWLKKSKISDNPNEIYLNDSRTYTVQKYAGFKQFAWGSFFLGVNYYLGIIEKTYIYTKR